MTAVKWNIAAFFIFLKIDGQGKPSLLQRGQVCTVTTSKFTGSPRLLPDIPVLEGSGERT